MTDEVGPWSDPTPDFLISSGKSRYTYHPGDCKHEDVSGWYPWTMSDGITVNDRRHCFTCMAIQYRGTGRTQMTTNPEVLRLRVAVLRDSATVHDAYGRPRIAACFRLRAFELEDEARSAAASPTISSNDAAKGDRFASCDLARPYLLKPEPSAQIANAPASAEGDDRAGTDGGWLVLKGNFATIQYLPTRGIPSKVWIPNGPLPDGRVVLSKADVQQISNALAASNMLSTLAWFTRITTGGGK